jgi:hypothetical protein
MDKFVETDEDVEFSEQLEENIGSNDSHQQVQC